MEVSWIKLSTTMFDDDKINFIETLPEKDAILIIWIRLLTMAGKCNEHGYIFITKNIPYSIDTLSAKVKQTPSVVRLALEILHKLNMLHHDKNNNICVTNFDKHQNIEGLEKIRLQNNERQKKFRQSKALKALPHNVTRNVTVTQSNATELELDLDKEKEKDITIAQKDIFSKHQRDLFNQFWAAYPKKRSIGEAEQRWLKINPSDELAFQIINAVKKSILIWGDPQFIQYPATWLNRKGWLDEISDQAVKMSGDSPYYSL